MSKLLYGTVGVIVLITVLLLFQQQLEGFAPPPRRPGPPVLAPAINRQGAVPQPRQIAAIPRAAPGAVTALPTVSTPQSKDLIATQNVLNTLQRQQAVMNIAPTATNTIQKQIETQLRPGAPPPPPQIASVSALSAIRADAAQQTKALATTPAAALTRGRSATVGKTQTLRSRSASSASRARTAKAQPTLTAAPKPVIAPTPTKPTMVGTTPGVITLPELISLRDRVMAEQLKLSNLRSTSPTIITRLNQLSKLQVDLNDIINKIQRNQMKIENVGISADAAQRFLAALPNQNMPLPPLLPTSPVASKPTAPSQKGPMPTLGAAPSSSGGMSQQSLEPLLKMAQYLKWNMTVRLEYDPKIAQRERVMKRIEEMEQRLTTLAMSETPVSKEAYEVLRKELETLAWMFGPEGSHNRGDPRVRMPTTYSRVSRIEMNPATNPSFDQMQAAQGIGLVPGQMLSDALPGSFVSQSTQVRPGIMMNDATIARRASSSSFDPSTVGGPDYKKRAQDLCRQVRSAQLGNPADFGCIANPNEVSSSYSWKGNYQMVCNRIGDTWGGWYPQMFGCPKYDPTSKFSGKML